MKTEFLLFLLFHSIYALSQEGSTFISGIILDSKTLCPVQNVHIINFANSKAYISDKSGKFNITLNTNDSIVLSSVGYKKKILKPHQIYSDTVFLIKDSIWTKTFVIYGLPSWNIFKKEFVELDIEKTKFRKNIIPGAIQYEGPYIEPKPTLLNNPATYLYEKYNKRAVLEKKLSKRRKLAETKWLNTQLK